MPRRYIDPHGVVHDASDASGHLTGGTKITLCERAGHHEVFRTGELRTVGGFTTCVMCLAAPDVLRGLVL